MPMPTSDEGPISRHMRYKAMMAWGVGQKGREAGGKGLGWKF